MTYLSIGEVASKTGIAASAIRYYEREGVLPAAVRVHGRRQYGADSVEQLRIIQVAQAVGFTLSELRVFLRDFPADTPPSVRWQAFAQQKLGEIDALLRHANAVKQMLERGLACQCATFTECLASLDTAYGPDTVSTDITVSTKAAKPRMPVNQKRR
jgi:MerR family transcriptional regulator, redox-sensitive transcriptional activator SoxR